MKRRKERGITIIELVIAMAVIAIALVQVMVVILHTSNLKQSTRELITAREAAASQFSIMKASDFDSVVFDFNNQIVDVAGLDNSNNPSGQGQLLILIDDSNQELLDILIEVEYDSIGSTRTYRARMMLTR